jgi:hypothetical protein
LLHVKKALNSLGFFQRLALHGAGHFAFLAVASVAVASVAVAAVDPVESVFENLRGDLGQLAPR